MSKPSFDPNTIEATVLGHIRGVRPVAGVDDAQMLDYKLRRVLDSIDMLTLLSFLEQTFGIKVSDQDVVGRNFESVRAIADFVRRKTASTAEVSG